MAAGSASGDTAVQAGPGPASGPGAGSDPLLELEVGKIAAGGGCVARAGDGRVVFVRHALPGERVAARVTAETRSFLRADAVTVLRPSADRVVPPCPHAGPGRCGGCDFQHVSLPAQRALKADLVAEQLERVAGIRRSVEVEEVEGAPDGLAWRTRVRFAVDRSGRLGLRRYRSHEIEPIDHCPIATEAVIAAAATGRRWRGARKIDVVASPDGGVPVVSVSTRHRRSQRWPVVEAGLAVDGRTVRPPGTLRAVVEGRPFTVGPGVFWQVHPGAGPALTRLVLELGAPAPGERVADLFCGAGLFTAALADAVGEGGAVVGVERSRAACADAARNLSGSPQVEIVRAPVDGDSVRGRLGEPALVVLDPARQGAGAEVMAALCALAPPLTRVVSVSCDPASFARDTRCLLDAGWELVDLRVLDLFPMTEHVELVGRFDAPGR